MTVTPATPRSVTKYRIGICVHFSVTCARADLRSELQIAAAGTDGRPAMQRKRDAGARASSCAPLRRHRGTDRRRRTHRAAAGAASGSPRVTAAAASPCRHQHRRHHHRSTGARVDLHPKHTLAQSEHVGDRRARRAQEQHGFFAGSEFRRADHHVPVPPDLSARHAERHGSARAALQIRCRVDG